MLSLSHTRNIRSSVAIAALLAVGFALCPSHSSAGDELVDEGLSQIVTEEAADRLAQYLKAYGIRTVQSIVVEGQFRSMSDETLSQKLTDSLVSHEIVVDEDSGTALTGQILLSESDQTSLVVMHCTLTDVNDGDLCTVRVRKVLASGN